VPATTSPAASAAPSAATPGTTASPTSAATPAPSLGGAVVRYVAIGASDTVGVGAADPATGSWPSRIASLLPAGSTYTNLGVSGSLASAARGQQLPRALDVRPTVVTIWLAVNDLNANVAVPSYTESLAGIVDGLLAGTQARIFVGSVPDLRAVPAYAQVDQKALAERIDAYNRAIAAVAARNAARVRVIDLFTGSAELVTNAVVAQDGFHPSDAGYQLIADRFAGPMRAAGVPLRG